MIRHYVANIIPDNRRTIKNNLIHLILNNDTNDNLIMYFTID